MNSSPSPHDLYRKALTVALPFPAFRFDGSWSGGTDEQEDELENVQKGILNPPTNDEGPGEIFESNKGDVALETEDENAGVQKPADAENDLKDFPGFKN